MENKKNDQSANSVIYNPYKKGQNNTSLSQSRPSHQTDLRVSQINSHIQNLKINSSIKAKKSKLTSHATDNLLIDQNSKKEQRGAQISAGNSLPISNRSSSTGIVYDFRDESARKKSKSPVRDTVTS